MAKYAIGYFNGEKYIAIDMIFDMISDHELNTNIDYLMSFTTQFNNNDNLCDCYMKIGRLDSTKELHYLIEKGTGNEKHYELVPNGSDKIFYSDDKEFTKVENLVLYLKRHELDLDFVKYMFANNLRKVGLFTSSEFLFLNCSKRKSELIDTLNSLLKKKFSDQTKFEISSLIGFIQENDDYNMIRNEIYVRMKVICDTIKRNDGDTIRFYYHFNGTKTNVSTLTHALYSNYIIAFNEYENPEKEMSKEEQDNLNYITNTVIKCLLQKKDKNGAYKEQPRMLVDLAEMIRTYENRVREQQLAKIRKNNDYQFDMDDEFLTEDDFKDIGGSLENGFDLRR